MIFKPAFYQQNACVVARELIGSRLVRQIGGQRVSGRIVEAEAYRSQEDQASHSHRGKTARNAPMWETAGRAYVYLIYGLYHLLNVTCEPEGKPAAVLIRAIEPDDGLAIIRANREGQPDKNLTSGPGRLTMALGIDRSFNRLNMTEKSSGLWIEKGERIADDDICTGPRIGLGRQVSEPWRSKPWRWWLKNNVHVSRPKK